MRQFILFIVLALPILDSLGNGSHGRAAAQAKEDSLPATPPEGILPVGADGKPLNLDFETGTLKDWKLQGDAFIGQPIKGDTVAKRLSGVKSQQQGQYWIGGYERRLDPPHGTLTSIPFKVTHPWGTFLVGGGPFPNTRVEIVRQDTGWVIFRASGEKKETMRRVAMNLQPYLDKEIFIRLVDLESGEWGHVNFDDFRFHSSKPKAPVLSPLAPPRPQVVVEAGGHTAQVNKVFFTADSKELVTVSQDRTIRVWDVETGELKRTLRPNFASGPGGVAVTPDRKTIAVYNGSNVILFLNIETGRMRTLRTDLMTRAGIGPLGFSADGQLLAVGTNSHDCFVVDVKSGRRINGFAPGGDSNGAVGFSPDGKRLTAFHEGPEIFDLTTGKSKGLPMGQAECYAWSLDSKIFAVGGSRHQLDFYDADTGKHRKYFEVGDVHSITFLPDDQLLLTGALLKNSARVCILNAKTGKVVVNCQPAGPWDPLPHTADVSPDGKFIASANHVGYIWDRQSGKLLRTLRGKGTPFFAAGWRNDGSAIAWGQRIDSKGKTYHTWRPLNTAFDLAELEILFKPDLKEYRRSVFKLGGATLNPDTARVVRDGKNIDLAPYGGAGGGTLLPNDRVVTVGGRWICLYDSKTPGEFDKERNRILIGGGRTLQSHVVEDDVMDVAPSPDNKYVLTASRDQVMRIWRVHPKSLELQLSLFVAGRDWIAWTPQGYYAATPGGEKLMGWKVENAVDRLASYYPAERFRKELYRPDIIKLVLKTGSVKEAIKAANAARGTETRNVKIEDLLPPKAILTVLDQSKLPTVKLRVQATAAAKEQPITALRLLMDGRPVPGKQTLIEYRDGQAKAEVEWTFELPDGEHQLAVLARSPDSSGVSRSVHVKNIAVAKLPTLHVLTVGINRYQDAALDLKYAAPDATALAEAFARNCKGQPFQAVTTRTLLNEKATTTAILQELTELRKQVEQQDLIVVFFACHGVKYKNGYYLLTHETNIDDLARTALAGEQLRTTLAGFKGQVLLMLDACHSAGFGAGQKLAKLGLKPATDDATRDLTEDECGVAVMCAAMANEKAEGQGGHGLFTQAVLEALEKKPGVPVPFNRHDQRIYVHHLQTFVFDEVSARSEQRQHPFLSLPWVVESFVIR